MPAPPTARTTNRKWCPAHAACLARPQPIIVHINTCFHPHPRRATHPHPHILMPKPPRYYGKFVGAHSEFMPFPIAPSSPSFDPHYLIPIHAMRWTHTQRVEWSSRNHRTFLATEKCRRSHAIIPPQLITVANGTQDLLIHPLLLLHHRPLRLNSPTQPAVHQ